MTPFETPPPAAPTEPETPAVADDEEGLERRPVAMRGMRPEDVARGIETFDDLPLHERIREATRKIGWQTPTPVQKLCLPFTLRGRDVAGFAQTGTGKTAVFLMTIANKLLAAEAAGEVPEARVTRAVVLAPTRELAMQIEQDAEVMFAHTGLSTMAVFGGIDYDKQARRLKEGVDVIFATPGRMMDYVKKNLVSLDHIAVFVCDEADRMFDMGFIEDVEFFLERIPETSQKLLFSATTNDQVKELAFEYLETPEYISVNPDVITPERIEQHALHCHATDKLKVLLGLLQDHNPDCSIIFTNTKLTAEWLHYKLVHNGIEADLISGDLPQNKRIKLIQNIKAGKLKALVATDVASRGLHISRVTHVYNFDLPDEAANYIHRIGRTARAGARGFAYSLVCDDYGQNLAEINELLQSGAGTGGLHTEWPDERYLTIQDKAGNPFEERYARRAQMAAGFQSGDQGSRDSRGPRAGARGPRSGDGAWQDRGGGGGRPRPEGRHEGRQESRGPQGAPGGQRPRQGQGRPMQHDMDAARGGPGQSEGGKRRRRRRGGKGGQGENTQQGGHHEQGRHTAGGRNGGQHHDGYKEGAGLGKPGEVEQAPKTMGGMLKRIVKTLFGWGK